MAGAVNRYSRRNSTRGRARLSRSLRIDPDADPWNDADVKRKIRWIGFGLSLFGLAVVILGIWMLAAT